MYEIVVVREKYKVIRRVEDGAFIPESLENKDYKAYQAWVASGNVAMEVSE